MSVPTPEQVREALPRQETAYPTETRWKYSNLAFVLAGEIVAAVSGQSYEDYVQQRILDPLGMSDTLVGAPRPGDTALAVGYGRRLPGADRAALSAVVDYRGITAAANLTSNVTDLAKFAMLQFRDRPAGGGPRRTPAGSATSAAIAMPGAIARCWCATAGWF